MQDVEQQQEDLVPPPPRRKIKKVHKPKKVEDAPEPIFETHALPPTLDEDQFVEIAPPIKKHIVKKPKPTTPTIISQPISQKYDIDQYDKKHEAESMTDVTFTDPPPGPVKIDKDKWRASLADGYSNVPLELFICTDHAGKGCFFPATLIVAQDEQHAITLLDKQLYDMKLDTSKEFAYTLHKVDLTKAHALVLSGACDKASTSAPFVEPQEEEQEMRVYICTTHYTVPAKNGPPVSFVVASNKVQAFALLDERLEASKCETSRRHKYVLEDISLYVPMAHVFSDGLTLRQI